MRVEIVRTGGLAGVRLRGVVDTRTLPGHAATEAERDLARLTFGATEPSAVHPDAFQYHIRLLKPEQTSTAVLRESDVPGGLRSLIEHAMAGAEIVDG